ncbi:MAG: SDR family NAD(P)-dependent oxidoreductase [Xanthomonadaceae bacterium]|jgi:NAD(P)-dependent dehydrogenase (short-subunit alcohol dehydrogenase family)|nr:SDR family NAD(P)-dependent oxidoreductase [Xanthomonadaceae bacterium]
MTPSTRPRRLIEQFLFPAPRIKAAELKACLQGKTILVTGASYGIGEALARRLAACGTHLLLVARSGDKLRALKTELAQTDNRIDIFATDLTDMVQVDALLNSIRRQHQGIDVFVSNAGKSIRRPLFDSLQRFHDFERTMQLNYYAPVRLSLALIPLLLTRGGQIVNVSAANVRLAPAPFWAAYQASKCAFDQWLRCAAPELAARGVACSSAYLPLVRTRMIEPTEAYRDAPAMSAEQAAALLCKLMLTRKPGCSPWWLGPGQWASLLMGGVWSRLAERHLRRTRHG